MADTIDILRQAAPNLAVDESKDGIRCVLLTASTRLDEINPETGKKKTVSTEFEANIPLNLDTAVRVLGEKAVYRFFINALVVELQGTARRELEPAKKGEGRKKARYLEGLGL